MTEATNDLIVEMPGRIQAGIGGLKADDREIRGRAGHTEGQLARLETRVADPSGRMDRRDDVMERVLRRLELTEPSH